MPPAEIKLQFEVASQRQLAIQNILSSFPARTLVEPLLLGASNSEVVEKVFGKLVYKVTFPSLEEQAAKTIWLAVAGMAYDDLHKYNTVDEAAADITRAHEQLMVPEGQEVYVVNINPLETDINLVDTLLRERGLETNFTKFLEELDNQLAAPGIKFIITYTHTDSLFKVFAKRIANDPLLNGRAVVITDLKHLPAAILSPSIVNTSQQAQKAPEQPAEDGEQ